MKSNLKAIFEHFGRDLPDAFQKLHARFSRFFEPTARGTLFSDLLDDTLSSSTTNDEVSSAPNLDNRRRLRSLKDDDFQLYLAFLNARYPARGEFVSSYQANSRSSLVANEVLVQDSVERAGVKFHDKSSSSRDCTVLFRHLDRRLVGQIRLIFGHSAFLGEARDLKAEKLTQEYAIIATYRPLSVHESDSDPYRIHGAFAGSVYHDDF